MLSGESSRVSDLEIGKRSLIKRATELKVWSLAQAVASPTVLSLRWILSAQKTGFRDVLPHSFCHSFCLGSSSITPSLVLPSY